jgi:hypothetical protein
MLTSRYRAYRARKKGRHETASKLRATTWLFNRRPDRWREKVEIERTGGWADRSPDEIKRALVQKMIMSKLVDPRNVPPDLLPAPNGTIDGEETAD